MYRKHGKNAADRLGTDEPSAISSVLECIINGPKEMRSLARSSSFAVDSARAKVDRAYSARFFKERTPRARWTFLAAVADCFGVLLRYSADGEALDGRRNGVPKRARATEFFLKRLMISCDADCCTQQRAVSRGIKAARCTH